MNSKKALKITAAVLSGVFTIAGTSMGAIAADSPTTEVEFSSIFSETEQSTTNIDSPINNPEDDTYESQVSEEKKWKKADVSDYDESLSLVSYELTTPEMLNDKSENAEESGTAELTDEKKAEINAKKDALRKASPSLSSKSVNITPTAVDVETSGGSVTNVPPEQGIGEINAQPGEFAFVTYGWGHGVGMSQNGANFYATYSGWTYQDILFHYFPGTYLMNTGLTDVEELTIAHAPAGTTLEVLSKIVFAEVGGTMSYEAIKAQAVAAYTYIKYNGDDSSDLRGKPNPPQIVIDACSEVLGEALYYDGEYALTMFSASSGGCSSNCYEVFYQDIPYLRSVPSDYDGAYDPHYGTITYISADVLRNKIESRYGITLSGDPGSWIQPIYSEQTGYATDVLIDGQMYVRAYAFSLALGLKSSKFNISYTY